MRFFLVSVFFFCLAGCSQRGWIDRLASPDEQRLALETAQELRDGNLEKLTKKAEPGFRAVLPKAIDKVRPAVAPAKGPMSIQDVVVLTQGESAVKSFTFESGSGSNWALTEVVLRGPPGALQLAGFRVLPTTSQPSRLNDFSISRRGLLGYLWLFAMGVCAALCISAVILIWRRPWLKRRWLWTLGSLLGFGGLALNWSTGAWTILLVNVSLLCATASKAGPYLPWNLAFGVPVVAIIVIIRWLTQAGRASEAEV